MKKESNWLILSQYYAPELGAPQIRLRAMVKELRKAGINARVLTAMPNYPAGKIFPGYEGKMQLREEFEGVPIQRTWVYAATGKRARVRLANYFSFTFTALIAALFGPKPDVLFLESQPLSLGLVAILMKWLRGVPYVYNVPDLQVDVARQLGFMSNETFLRVAFALENFFLRHSWKVSTVTDRFIEHFVERGLPRDQVTFLPNGADSDFLKPLAPDPELAERWQIGERKVFMYVGTHAYYHGLDTLIEAAAHLKDREDILFLLIGRGPERERLKALAQDLGLPNVIFGQSPYEEMARLYSLAYASVATLRDMEVAKDMRLSKVFPALACAVPVIYSGKGEAAELLVANRCGEMTAPEDPEALAAAIIRLVDNPERRQHMAAAGRQLIDREYSWRAIVASWLDEIDANTKSSVSAYTHPA